jgi:hypothetical protein
MVRILQEMLFKSKEATPEDPAKRKDIWSDPRPHPPGDAIVPVEERYTRGSMNAF